MNDRIMRAAVGFVAGAVALAALQAVVNDEAGELGLPHVVAGALVALIGDAID